MVFEGVVGGGYNGDIAIDDIRMSPTSCLGLVNCDFENGDTCSWTQNNDDDFDFLVNNGATGSVNTGPSNDHTVGNAAGN